MTFESRESAGKLLGEELKRRGVVADMIFGLARGGVVVAAEVARILHVPLIPIVVRKIGAPGNEEFALGAVSEIPGTDRAIVRWDERALKMVHVAEDWKKQRIEEKKIEVLTYRNELKFSSHFNRFGHVLLVDDGAATGTSMLAAISSVRQVFPHSVMTAALPASSPEASEKFQTVVDDLVILYEGEDFSAVGECYKDFPQVEWEDVRKLL